MESKYKECTLTHQFFFSYVGPVAVFHQLLTQRLLTLNLDLQLKANPGVWEILLKHKSRSESLYHFVGTSSRVILDSFDGSFQRVMVSLRNYSLFFSLF